MYSQVSFKQPCLLAFNRHIKQFFFLKISEFNNTCMHVCTSYFYLTCLSICQKKKLKRVFDYKQCHNKEGPLYNAVKKILSKQWVVYLFSPQNSIKVAATIYKRNIEIHKVLLILRNFTNLPFLAPSPPVKEGTFFCKSRSTLHAAKFSFQIFL